jgi:hypothetical protein
MTEEEWLDCNDATRSVCFVKRGASERRLMLLAAACCRDMWPLLTDPRSRAGVETLEAVADGKAKFTQYEGAFGDAWSAWRELGARPAPCGWAEEKRLQAAVHAARAAACLNWPIASAVGGVIVFAASAMKKASRSLRRPGRPEAKKYRLRQHRLIEEVFGNPFRRVSVERAWLAWNGGTVGEVAGAIYDEKRFDDLPVLADALEDAACDNDDMLNHLRSPGPHVRGCWAVDLVLGKE